jgi:hypothetical protein
VNQNVNQLMNIVIDFRTWFILSKFVSYRKLEKFEDRSFRVAPA